MSIYKTMWTTEEGIALCKLLEPIAEVHNCHVALTGGLCYKEGPRKDCDVAIYIRGQNFFGEPMPLFIKEKIIAAFSKVLTIDEIFYRVTKATYQDKSVDLLFVNMEGEYE